MKEATKFSVKTPRIQAKQHENKLSQTMVMVSICVDK